MVPPRRSTFFLTAARFRLILKKHKSLKKQCSLALCLRNWVEVWQKSFAREGKQRYFDVRRYSGNNAGMVEMGDRRWIRNDHWFGYSTIFNDDGYGSWVNHSMTGTARRAQSVPIARRDEMTEGPVQTEAGRTGMEQNDETLGTSRPTVVVNLDWGFQLYVWTPEMTGEELRAWFLGLPEKAIASIWDDPKTLPGRVEKIALARPQSPTHVLSVEGKKDISLVEIKEGFPERGTLLVRGDLDVDSIT